MTMHLAISLLSFEIGSVWPSLAWPSSFSCLSLASRGLELQAKKATPDHSDIPVTALLIYGGVHSGGFLLHRCCPYRGELQTST